MIFAGSCQQENLEPVAQENTVTYTVELPDVQTKAIGDAGNVNDLIYEVWVTKGEKERDLNGFLNDTPRATRLYQKTEPILNGRTVITLDLVQDQNYTILFWAQKRDGQIYVTNDLTNIEYAKGLNGGEDGYKSNDELHAAFYGIDFFYNDNRNIQKKTVTLKRPFAQLNIASLNTSTEYGVEVLESKVVVEGVGTTFNVAQNYLATPEDPTSNNGVGNAKTVVFDYNTDPSGENEYLFINGEKSDYEHIAMNYLFATGQNVKVSYNIRAKLTGLDKANAGTETEVVVSNDVYEVPLQENYRTNIVGNLLTSTAEYTVIIDQDFANPDYVIGDAWSQSGNYNYTVNTGAYAAALKEILEHADAAAKANLNLTKSEGPVVTINLSENVEWETGAGHGSTPLLSKDSPISAVVINGNGKTFTATGKGVGAICLANGGKLTFNNVNIVDKSVSYDENAWEFTYLEFDGKLAFNNCTFNSGVQFESGEVVAENCRFISNEDSVYAVWICGGTTTFKKCTFEGTRGLKAHEDYGSEVASVVVDGCTFNQISKKPGIALGTLNADTSVTIQNSIFDRCQAGDQENYMYETDTDVNTFNFVRKDNVVIPSGDGVVKQENGTLIVSSAAGLKAAIATADNNAFTEIKLADGTYTGAFDIDAKSVKISALNTHKATIDGLVHGLNFAHVTLNGVVLTNATPAASGSARHNADYYCLGSYVTDWVIEDCIFNVNNQGQAAGKGAINIYAGRDDYELYDGYEFTVKNTVFNCNGERPIRGKTNSWVEGCTFVDQHRYAIQVQGNSGLASETVKFVNNTIVDPCKTSGEAYVASVSISKSQLIEDAAFIIEGNTDAKFVYDNNDNVKITTCTLNSTLIAAGQCVSIPGVDDAKEVIFEYEEGTTLAATSEDLTAALNGKAKDIILLPGTYEGTFAPKAATSIKSATASDKAVIKGRVNINAVNCSFENIKFDVNGTDSVVKKPTNFGGTNYQYPALVFVKCASTTFTGCEFKMDLNKVVAAINYGDHSIDTSNQILTLTNCSFDGDFYAVRTRPFFNITGCTFNNTYPGVGPTALWVFGNGDSSEGSVIFQNNKAITSYDYPAIAMQAKNQPYQNITFDVRNNEDFTQTFATSSLCTYANNTFVGGSETFGVPVTSTESLNNAIAKGEQYVYLTAGEYTLPSISNGEVKISGSSEAVITIGTPNLSGTDVTFEGVKIKGSGYATGVQHANTVTYNDVTVVGEMCLYGEKVVFNNATFELNKQYIWTYGAKEAEFNNCTFNTNGKAILVYNEGAGANTVTVNGCTFNATEGAMAGAIANQNCAAIEIDNFQSSGVGAAHTVTATNNTYDDNFSGEWRIKNYVVGNPITVNGVEYESIAIDGSSMTIDSEKKVTVL